MSSFRSDPSPQLRRNYRRLVNCSRKKTPRSEDGLTFFLGLGLNTYVRLSLLGGAPLQRPGPFWLSRCELKRSVAAFFCLLLPSKTAACSSQIPSKCVRLRSCYNFTFLAEKYVDFSGRLHSLRR